MLFVAMVVGIVVVAVVGMDVVMIDLAAVMLMTVAVAEVAVPSVAMLGTVGMHMFMVVAMVVEDINITLAAFVTLVLPMPTRHHLLSKACIYRVES